MLWADGFILWFSYGQLRAVDPADGATRWTMSVPDGYYLFPPLCAATPSSPGQDASSI